MMQIIPEGTPFETWFDEDGYQHVKFLIEDDYNNPSKPNQHIIPVGNKVYHAEMYIKDAEMKKDKIKEAVRQLEAYFEQNKNDIEWIELGKSRMRLNDALYFLNKIKECVNDD